MGGLKGATSKWGRGAKSLSPAQPSSLTSRPSKRFVDIKTMESKGVSFGYKHLSSMVFLGVTFLFGIFPELVGKSAMDLYEKQFRFGQIVHWENPGELSQGFNFKPTTRCLRSVAFPLPPLAAFPLPEFQVVGHQRLNLLVRIILAWESVRDPTGGKRWREIWLWVKKKTPTKPKCLGTCFVLAIGFLEA